MWQSRGRLLNTTSFWRSIFSGQKQFSEWRINSGSLQLQTHLPCGAERRTGIKPPGEKKVISVHNDNTDIYLPMSFYMWQIWPFYCHLTQTVHHSYLRTLWLCVINGKYVLWAITHHCSQSDNLTQYKISASECPCPLNYGWGFGHNPKWMNSLNLN